MKYILTLLFFTLSYILLAESVDTLSNIQNDSIQFNKNIDSNSVIFNKDSLMKYSLNKYKFIYPLRISLYPNYTGLTDNELFERYKKFQKATEKGFVFKRKENVVILAEFIRIIGENPYNYLGKGKFVYEYEIVEILRDAYQFYKIGDKIKVYEGQPYFGEIYEYKGTPFYKTLKLGMSDKGLYEYDKIMYGIKRDDEIYKIWGDLYSTDDYFPFLPKVVESHFKQSIYEYKDSLRKEEIIYWYNCKLFEK